MFHELEARNTRLRHVGPIQVAEYKTGLLYEHAFPLRILLGWRQIAIYLGISVRSARRWHMKWEFPVVRLVGKRVFTTEGAIDTWIFRMDKLEREVRAELAEERARRALSYVQ